MDAKAAKEKTEKTIESMITPQYEKVMKEIDMAILSGRYFTNIMHYLYDGTLQRLKKDGYKISTRWRKHGDYKISWK